jgi:hypothetical protein
MNLDMILQEWKKDSYIEFNKLDVSSQLTPEMHAKYLELYTNAKLRLKDAELKQKVLLKDKYLYYEGKMPKEDIDTRGWSYDPYDGLTIRTNREKEHYYETDKDIQESEAKIVYLSTIVETLKEIMDNIKWRHSTIKNMIDWKKFEAGF